MVKFYSFPLIFEKFSVFLILPSHYTHRVSQQSDAVWTRMTIYDLSLIVKRIERRGEVMVAYKFSTVEDKSY